VARWNGCEKRRVRLYRKAAWHKQQGHCYWCKTYVPEAEATGDHLEQWAHGGRASKRNIVMACSACNNLRSNPPPHTAHIRAFYAFYARLAS
jgi:5-methylcytosine-specific restriction protein A